MRTTKGACEQALELGVGLFWHDTSLADFVALVAECEALGYEYLWVSNEKFFRDMYVTATLVALHTRRARIGTFVADPYTMHPALTATAIGTLDEISGGRAVLGLGAGGTGFPAMGITRRKPALAIRDTVAIVHGLLRGEEVDHPGEVVGIRRGRLNFRPRADIPIVVATRGDRVLEVAGEVADGVMIATYAEPAGIRHALGRVTAGMRRAGRQPADLRIISRVDAAISADRRAAIEAVKPMVAVFLWTSYPDRAFVHRVGLEVPPELERIIARRDYNLLAANAHLVPDAFVDKFCWAGTVDDVIPKVAAVARLGIREITFLPHAIAGGDVRETVRAFAEVVRPAVDAELRRQPSATP